MKKFPVLIALSFLVSITAITAMAAEPFLEDFDSATTFPPPDWTILHFGNCSQWQWGWQDGHSGIHSAEIRPCWNNDPQDEWLITPAYDTTGAQYLYLDFWESGRYWTTGGGIHEVLVSTTVADDPAAFTSVWQVTPGSYVAPWLDSWKEEWVNVQIELPQFVGEIIYVAFRYDSEVSTDYWWLDDVRLRTPVEHDVTAVAVLPSGEAWLPGTEFTPQLMIENAGVATESFSAEMVIEHDGMVVYSETVPLTDLAFSTAIVADFPPFTCAVGDYLLQGAALLATDMNPADNTAVSTNVCFSGQRVPLGILYTNWACTPCVEANIAFDEWYPLQGDDAGLIRVHVSWPSSQDPMYVANPDQSQHLLFMCPVTVDGVPHLYLDNTLSVPSVDEIGWPTLIDDAYAHMMYVSSPIEMSMTFDQSDSTANVVVDVLDPMPAGTYSLFVAVTEDSIYALGSNGEEYHNQAFRWMYPDEIGHPIATAQGTHAYTIDLDLNPTWVQENLRATAWVQADTAGVIINSTKLMIGDYITAVDPDATAPAAVRLLGARPNPFNPRTTISFDLPREQIVSLRIYDVSGRLVDVLLSDDLAPAGRNEVVWHGKDLAGRTMPSGTYCYRLESGGYTESGRMTLLK